uniref:Uncharacterized protein n=1 Tax=Arundo donax TaxID=35708 RepID=A0A0A8ZS51_ARUDO
MSTYLDSLGYEYMVKLPFYCIFKQRIVNLHCWI